MRECFYQSGIRCCLGHHCHDCEDLETILDEKGLVVLEDGQIREKTEEEKETADECHN